MLRFKDRYTVTVQPAGSAGERQIFLTISGAADTNKQIKIELVISEHAANNLGDALISGSLGILRELEVQETMK
jgi:hypothetical protein